MDVHASPAPLPELDAFLSSFQVRFRRPEGEETLELADSSLPAEQDGSFLRALFPRYYLWGSILALACSASAWLSSAGGAMVGVSFIVLLLFVYARQFLMPAINRARDRDLEGDARARARFRALHLQSVLINALQLLLLLAASAYLLWS